MGIDKNFNRKKDTILLMTFITFLTIFIPLFYIIWPTYSSYTQSQETFRINEEGMAKLSQQLKELEKEDPSLIDYQKRKLKEQLPSYLLNESIILELDDLEKKAGLEINHIAFAEDKDIKLTDYIKDKNNAGIKNRLNDIQFITKPVHVNMDCDYESLYNFISLVENRRNKVSINQLSFSVGESGKIVGNMTLEYILLREPSDVETLNLDINNELGRNNPFYSKDYDVNVNENKVNFQILMNDDGNQPAYIMGVHKKPETEIYHGYMDSVHAIIEIDRKGREFIYDYSLGNKKRSRAGILELNDGILKMEIVTAISLEELANKLTVDVINNTEFALEVTIINDDITNPRVNIMKQEGKVHIKRVNQ